MENSLKVLTKIIGRLEVDKLPSSVKQRVLDYVASLTKTDAIICGSITATVIAFTTLLTAFASDTEFWSEGGAVQLIEEIYNTSSDPNDIYEQFVERLDALKGVAEINASVAKSISSKVTLEKLFVIVVSLGLTAVDQLSVRIPLTPQQIEQLYRWLNDETHSIFQIIAKIIGYALLEADVEDIPINYISRLHEIPSQLLPLSLTLATGVAQVIIQRPETRRFFVEHNVLEMFQTIVELQRGTEYFAIASAVRYLAAEARKMDPNKLRPTTIMVSRYYNPWMLYFNNDSRKDPEITTIDILATIASYCLRYQTLGQIITNEIVTLDMVTDNALLVTRYIDNRPLRVISRCAIVSGLVNIYFLSLNSKKAFGFNVAIVSLLMGIGYVKEIINGQAMHHTYLEMNQDKLGQKNFVEVNHK